ncbi:scavenger mRNA decapping enzyme [Morchella conica CCBAS932]|uniref:Scavenger mRNA decapping enzyme n=1 Tax=Morchella conica CCBAS932 TaxID=1392247 RepID=A0A3N4KJ44_9PEZI|nr:scavenger mRNA decapping enzyme [Morchella conica CCBAS932]
MSSPTPEDLLRQFKFSFLINQDTRTKSVNLLGTIASAPAILIAEKTAFDISAFNLSHFPAPALLPAVALVEKNDIYHWFLASTVSGVRTADALAQGGADVKITMIWPATEAHVRKYSKQNVRMVEETAEVYRRCVWPYVQAKREGGRLGWVYNILEGKAEAESVIVRDDDPVEGFILLPDLKWDRKTMASLYTMALVQRRDITSLRDLKKRDVPWLKRLQANIIKGVCAKYPSVEPDQLKLYIHYQPSYYHFHIHAVSVTHDGGMGQAAGRALLLGNVISQLEWMGGGEEAGFADVTLTYFVGEESELWQGVFEGLREKRNCEEAAAVEDGVVGDGMAA